MSAQGKTRRAPRVADAALGSDRNTFLGRAPSAAKRYVSPRPKSNTHLCAAPRSTSLLRATALAHPLLRAEGPTELHGTGPKGRLAQIEAISFKILGRSTIERPGRQKLPCRVNERLGRFNAAEKFEGLGSIAFLV
jgi:hypothetical protein